MVVSRVNFKHKLMHVNHLMQNHIVIVIRQTDYDCRIKDLCWEQQLHAACDEVTSPDWQRTPDGWFEFAKEQFEKYLLGDLSRIGLYDEHATLYTTQKTIGLHLSGKPSDYLAFSSIHPKDFICAAKEAGHKWLTDDMLIDRIHMLIKDRISVDSYSYWYFTMPKYDSIRTIELSQDVVNALEREKARQEQNRAICDDLYIRWFCDDVGHLNCNGNGAEIHLVMVRPDGSYINSRNMQHVSHIARHELGIPKFDYHSLRHTHATMLAERGASPKYVQHRLGHKNIQVTMQIYQHLTDKMSEEGAKLLDTL